MEQTLLFLLYFLCLCSTSYSQSVVKGKIEGLTKEGIDKIYIHEARTGDKIIDSSFVTDDSFQFNLTRLEPGLYNLGVPKNSNGFMFWIDNHDITVVGDIKHLKIDKTTIQLERMYPKVSLKGSVNQDLHNSFFASIREDLDKYYARPAGGYVILREGEIHPKKIIASRVEMKCHDFVLKHPDKLISAFLIFYLGNHEGIIPENQTFYLRSLLTQEMQKSEFGNLIITWKN